MSTPELLFQQHVADFLEREHGYERLGKDAAIDLTDVWMADVLWAFVVDTQPEAVETLRGQYGSAARDEFFHALRDELRHTPSWMILRHGLMVRGASFRQYYPRPRSAESAAAPYGRVRAFDGLHGQNDALANNQALSDVARSEPSS